MKTIDLNADMGEGAGTDMDLLKIVSSASIACGGHAGDVDTMRATLRAAKEAGVTCGAHPGFIDREHFGRRRLDLSQAELEGQVRGQLHTISEIAKEEGVALKYVKLHGALANMAAEDNALATSVFTVVQAHDPKLAILAIDNSEQVRAAKALNIQVIREAYADRAYTPGGLLVSRNEPGAVLADPETVIAQCLRLAMKGEIVTVDGSILKSAATSICLHGDTEGAVELANCIQEALHEEGIAIKSRP